MDIQSKRLSAAAREILKSHGFFVDNLWHANDIIFLCKELNYPELTLSECMSVFDIANEQFDGEYGICWPELERALKIFMHSKDKEKTHMPEQGKEA